MNIGGVPLAPVWLFLYYVALFSGGDFIKETICDPEMAYPVL
jgi:hypothetical protein